MTSPRLSIVVPALNEAARVAELASHLATVAPEAEVVLVDGGSDDGTAQAARKGGLTVIEAPRGRARQMNAGAAATSGDVILFLHADTLLPAGAAEAAVRACGPGVALGAFGFRLDHRPVALKIIELGVWLRCRWGGLPLGDQALFLPRDVFDALGGYAPLPILEDMDLVTRARAHGRVVVLPQAVVTSARRWRERGVLRTTAENWWVTVRFALGWRPEQSGD